MYAHIPLLTFTHAHTHTHTHTHTRTHYTLWYIHLILLLTFSHHNIMIIGVAPHNFYDCDLKISPYTCLCTFL